MNSNNKLTTGCCLLTTAYMHIRINIPAWSGKEIAAGASALFSGARSRRNLQSALEREARGWRPLLVSSARYAIALAARALGLEGRRVAVPGYVCPAVLTGLRAAEVEIVPLDCRIESVQFDFCLLARASEGDIDAMLAPNTYGLDQDFASLNRLGLPVIEDAAYQAGRKDAEGNLCGARASAGVWSFNFKSLTAVGGGALIVRDAMVSAPEETRPGRLKETLRFLNYAARSAAKHRIPKFLPGAEAPGLDDSQRAGLLEILRAPMTELQAAVAFAQWQSRAKLFEIQKRNSHLLFESISRSEAFTPLAREGDAMPHLFPALVRVNGKDASGAVHLARRILHHRGVQTESPYPILLGSSRELPNTYDLASRLILIPCNASLREKQIRLVASALEEASREVMREFRISARAESL